MNWNAKYWLMVCSKARKNTVCHADAVAATVLMFNLELGCKEFVIGVDIGVFIEINLRP